MRLLAWLIAVVGLLFSAAWTVAAASGTYRCSVAETPMMAIESLTSGKGELTFAVDGEAYAINGAGIDLKGKIAAEAAADASVTDPVAPVFSGAPVHVMTGDGGLAMARGAFAADTQGVAVAYVALYGGTYHLVCFDRQAGSADFAAAGTAHAQETQEQTLAGTTPAEPELTDEQKLEKLFATAPEQKGKEVELFGRVSLSRPDEGHYACKATSYFSDGETRTNDMIDSDDDHIGFDLFSDGSVRLKKTDGTFENTGDDWRHNPANGVVLFNEGTLSVYFKWPVHVRKKLSETLPEVSILYSTDYDYDGPLDDMTLCVFSGPPQSKSPKAAIAELAQKNLNPPPPGTPVKAAGLYYQQQWVTQMGFGNPPQMYQEDYYYYRYFQPNGYVWLDGPPADGDFEKLGCNKPMVDDKGEPTCTTYSIEDGLLSKPTIRVGHDAPIPFEEGDKTVSLDGTQYFFVEPQSNLRLDKFVRYFSYNGIAMREGNFSFKADGTYESTSGSGVSFTTEIPDVSRTTVSGYNPGDDLKGKYEINGHTITLINQNGGNAKMFFGYFSDGFFMIGGQPYFEPSD